MYNVVQNPAFGPAQIRALTGVFTEKANMLRDRIDECISAENIEGTRVDMLSWLSKATLDVIGQAGELNLCALLVSIKFCPLNYAAYLSRTGFNYRFDALNPSLPPNEFNVLFTNLSNYIQEASIIGSLQDAFPILRFIVSISFQLFILNICLPPDSLANERSKSYSLEKQWTEWGKSCW